jgi:hypothetical protein
MVYFQTRKIPIWVNFGGSACNGRCWYVLWPFGLFKGYLVYLKAIWYILWSFGIFFPILECCTKNVLATLVHGRGTENCIVILLCPFLSLYIAKRDGVSKQHFFASCQSLTKIKTENMSLISCATLCLHSHLVLVPGANPTTFEFTITTPAL